MDNSTDTTIVYRSAAITQPFLYDAEAPMVEGVVEDSIGEEYGDTANTVDDDTTSVAVSELSDHGVKELTTKYTKEKFSEASGYDASNLQCRKTINVQTDILPDGVSANQLRPWFDYYAGVVDWITDRKKFVAHSMAKSEELGRPAVSSSSLVFQTTGFDYAIDDYAEPVIHMYGIKDDGRSVMVKVRNFLPYFYVRKPEHWTDVDVAVFIRALSQQMYAKLWYSTRSKNNQQAANERQAANIALLKENKMTSDDVFAERYPNGLGSNIVKSYEVVRARGLEAQTRIRKKDETDEFIKIILANPSLITQGRNLCMNANGGTEGMYDKKYPIRAWLPGQLGVYTHLDVYEANIPYIQRFIMDLRWADTKHAKPAKNNLGHFPETCLAIPRDRLIECKSVFAEDETHWPVLDRYSEMELCDRIMYVSPSRNAVTSACSSCDLEYTCDWKDIEFTDEAPYFTRPFPRRMCMYDIEVTPKSNGEFGTPDADPVLNICAILNTTSDTRKVTVWDKKAKKNVVVTTARHTAYDFCLERDIVYENAEEKEELFRVDHRRVYCFEYEQMMLHCFRMMLVLTGMHVLGGHNNHSYDDWYLLERARHLQVDSFKYLGKNLRKASFFKETTFNSAARVMKSKFTYIPGVQQLDVMLTAMNTLPGMRSYALGALSEEYIGKLKKDVAYSSIRELFMTPEGRTTLRVYCSFDSLLTFLVAEKTNLYMNTVAFARIVGIPFQDILERGQQYRVFTLLKRYTAQRRNGEPEYLIPYMRSDERVVREYPGATVIDPKTGLYYNPVATLDFAGLYPSIMMAHNLCYASLLRGGHDAADRLGLVNGVDYYSVPKYTIDSRRENLVLEVDRTSPVFLAEKHQSGFLPRMLWSLRDDRTEYKRLMAAEEPGSPMRSVYNLLQNAVKLVQNATYGFTGAQRGILPCIEIAFTVTMTGQVMNAQTCAATYKLIKEHKIDAEIVYGDTDSIMIRFIKWLESGQPITIAEAETLGVAFAKWITDNTFNKPPIELAYEKLYTSMLLLAKKRYAGLKKLLNSPVEKEISVSGLECKRRDNCLLLSTVMTQCLKSILIDRNLELTKRILRDSVHDVINGEINLHELIISKRLSKSEYKTANILGVLVERMRDRDPNNAPRLGDRIPYVIIQERVHDPFLTRMFADPTQRAVIGKDLDLSRVTLRAEEVLYAIRHPDECQIDWKYYKQHMLEDPIRKLLTPLIADRLNQKTMDGDVRRADRATTIIADELDAIFSQQSTVKNAAIKLGRQWKHFKIAKQCMECKKLIVSGSAVCNTCLDIRTITKVRENNENAIRKIDDEYRLWYGECMVCTDNNEAAIKVCTKFDCEKFLQKETLTQRRVVELEKSARIRMSELLLADASGSDCAEPKRSVEPLVYGSTKKQAATVVIQSRRQRQRSRVSAIPATSQAAGQADGRSEGICSNLSTPILHNIFEDY